MKKVLQCFLLFVLATNLVEAQCVLNLQVNEASRSCVTAQTEARFTNVTGATTSSNNVTKTGSNGWNASAFGLQPIYNNGYAQTTILETNNERVFGLNPSDEGVSQNNIDYGFYFRNNGQYEVIENGTSRISLGGYAANDVFRIQVLNNEVQYLRNGNVVFNSAITPSLPLYVDIALNSANSTIRNVLIGNGSNGVFKVEINNAGTNPTYAWTVNGVARTGNSAVLNAGNLAVGDVVACTVTPGSGGCSATPQVTNTITLVAGPPTAMYTPFLLPQGQNNACFSASFPVRVAQISNNLRISGNNITKYNNNNSWSDGFFGTDAIYNNGSVRFTAGNNNSDRVIGLSATNIDNTANTITFGIYLRNNGNFNIYEAGNDRGNIGGYSSTDQFTVAIEDGSVKYYRNGTLVYVSTVVPTFPLYVDGSMHSTGAAFNAITLTNGITQTYQIQGQNLNNSSYSWFVNNVPAGSNSNVFTLSSPNTVDNVRCVVTPGDYGCSSFTVATATVATNVNTIASLGLSYTKPQYANSACREAVSNLAFKMVENLNEQGNTLIKIQNNNSWNGHAVGVDSVYAGGYIQFTGGNTNTDRIIGLTDNANGNSINNIDFAIYLRNNGSWSIFESGNDRGGMGGYSGTDIFRIAIEGAQVKYYRNGNLTYVSNTALPTLPLAVDVNIHNVNGRFNNIVIANGTVGTLMAYVQNAGNAANYRWYQNGNQVGSNNPILNYSNSSNGDNFNFEVNPSLPGCANYWLQAQGTTLNNLAVNPQVSVIIKPQYANTACREVRIPATAVQGVNVNITGNTIIKIQSNNNWDGAATVLDSVYAGGYLQFTAGNTNTDRMMGLTTNAAGNGYSNINYAIYLRNNGSWSIFENGNDRGGFGGYSGSDIFRIAIEGNQVKYYRNSNIVYISLITPTSPMAVDFSIQNVNGRFNAITIVNGTTGLFTAVTAMAGNNPTYAWSLNGTTVGSNSAVYNNPNLNTNDIVGLSVTPDLGGCSNYAYDAQDVNINLLAINPQISFYVNPSKVQSACRISTSQLSFTNLVNVNATGNTLVKIQNNNNWDGGATGLDSVYAGGSIQFTPGNTNTNRMIGLTTNAAGNGYSNINYAIYLRNNSNWSVFENGNDRGSFGGYGSTDVFRIALEGNQVKYYRNNAIVYISLIAPVLPLAVDVSIENVNGRINNITISNNNNGVFTATATGAGTNPTYKWFLNGNQVAATRVYTNNSLSNNDTLRAVLTPDLGGCVNLTYTSLPVSVFNNVQNPEITFYIRPGTSATACKEASAQASFTNLVNINATGNTLVKIQNNNSWDGGATALDSVYTGGFVQFSAGNTNTDRMIGLTTNAAGNGYNNITYAIYLRNNANWSVFENGNDRGGFGGYSSTDVFKIVVDGNQVKYYRNNVLAYISNISPTTPLLVDVAINDVNGRFNNVRIGNGNTGTFTAITTGAGANPTFSWMVNGVPTGVTTRTYTNNNLANNDTLTCIVSPDLGGCGNFAYTSAPIVLSNIVNNDLVSVYIRPVQANIACKEAATNVRFNQLVNVEATDNNLLKIQGNGFDAGAIALDSLYEGGYVQFTPGNTNTDRYVGLATNAAGVSTNNMRYAILLRNNANWSIFENGADMGGFGGYASTDVFTIQIIGGRVHYLRNNTLAYISTLAPARVYAIDFALGSTNARVNNILVKNGNTGTFNAVLTGTGPNPSFQWRLNNVAVGTNSPNYTNNSLEQGDSLTVFVNPDLPGCGNSGYSASPIVIEARPFSSNTTFYITNAATPSPCRAGSEQVFLTALQNVVALGTNSVRKTQGTQWDGGAFSLNPVWNNSAAITVIDQTNTERVFGLSATNSDAGQNSIQFGLYLRNNGQVQILESGNNRGTFGSYAVNDTMRISITNNQVRYLRNNTVIYTSTLTPSLPLYVDISIQTTNGRVSNVSVINNAIGVFDAVAQNVGNNPTYRWRVNGNTVQNGSNVRYTNYNLNFNDVVTCTVTPDLGGCTLNSAVVSNSIRIQNPIQSTPLPATTTWNGSLSSDWNNSANWSNGVPDAYRTVVIAASTPNAPIVNAQVPVNNLTINSGAVLQISGQGTLNVYGNITNNGTLNGGSGTVRLAGCGLTTQVVSGSNQNVFPNLVLANPRNFNFTHSNISIAGNLELSRGVVNNTNTIVFLDNATVTGASDSTHFTGAVSKIGNDDFVFPIGSNNKLTPVAIKDVNDVNAHFIATYVNGDPNALYPVSSKHPLIDSIIRNNYWMLDRLSTTGNARVGLSWSNVLPTSRLVVSRWNGTQWEDNGGIELQGDSLKGIIYSSNPFTSFSPFALARRMPPILPITLIQARATAEKAGNVVQWLASQSATGQYHFEVQYATNATDFTTAGMVEGAATTLPVQYRFDHPYTQQGIIYYRLKMVDIDGKVTYSNTMLVRRNDEQWAKMSVFPNPSVQENINVQWNGIANQLIVTNALGQEIVNQPITGDSSSAVLPATQWPAGLYFIRVQMLDGTTLTQKHIVSRF